MNVLNYLIITSIAVALGMFDNFLSELNGVAEWRPDSFALLIVWIGGSYSVSFGAIMSLSIGLIRDAFLGAPVGSSILYALALIYFGFIVYNQVPPLLIGIVLAITSVFVSHALNSWALNQSATDLLSVNILMSILSTSLSAPIFFKVFNAISKAQPTESTSRYSRL